MMFFIARIHKEEGDYLVFFPDFPHIKIAYQHRNIRNGHSQSEIATKLGISCQAYQKLENPRKCNPTVKTLERISEVFGKVPTISLK